MLFYEQKTKETFRTFLANIYQAIYLLHEKQQQYFQRAYFPIFYRDFSSLPIVF